MALQIAILVYPQMTALDAVGPYEVLSRIPGAQVSWVAQDLLPVTADAGLTLVPTATFATLTRPEVVVVPGGREGFAIREPAILAWLRAVHPHTRFTTSVCTGALVLGAAGLLRGVRATTHWYKLSQLKTYGARPTRRRVVQDGRIVTAAGVSAGIDMGLTLAQRLAGTTAAKVIQLGIEYDPHPPFQSGSPHSASWLTRGIAYLAMRRYNAVRPNTSQAVAMRYQPKR